MISKTEKRAKIRDIIVNYDADRALRVPLTGHWSRCPEYWRNFVRSFRFPDDGLEDRTETLDAALAEWHVTREFNEVGEGKYYVGESVLVFATEADKTLFILRWS